MAESCPNSPFILTGVSALRQRQTLQNPHPSPGVLIWELDPISGQHHKNYLSKRDLQVPYREKGMSWTLEVKICQGCTCWRHQKGCDVLFFSSSERNSDFGSLWRLFSMHCHIQLWNRQQAREQKAEVYRAVSRGLDDAEKWLPHGFPILAFHSACSLQPPRTIL